MSPSARRLLLLLLFSAATATPSGGGAEGDGGAEAEAGGCSGHTCRMLCAYGFATDEQGCPLCRCYDPCSEIKCAGALTCQLEEPDVPCSRPPCLPVPTCKKGRSLDNVCPSGAPLTMPGSGVPPRPFLCGQAPGQPRCPPLFECSVQPGNDYGVCCPGGARLEKAGACPARGELRGELSSLAEVCGPACQADQDCPGPLKCCGSAACGLSCTPPANLTECRQLRQLSVQLSVSEHEGRGYVPQCDPVTGAFRPRQCSRNGRVCWCVDGSGNKVPGSMGSGASVRCPHPNEASRGRSMASPACPVQPQAAGRCAQVCEFGFRVDSDGCQTCECDDPCAGAVCGPQEECVVLRDPSCDGLLCTATPICQPSATAQPQKQQQPPESKPQEQATERTEQDVSSQEEAEEPRQATMCEYLRDFRDKMEGTRDGMSLAMKPPSCRPDGSFNETQCYGGECWCVDSFGTEIPQSRTFNASGPSPGCRELRETLDCLDLTCRLGCEFGFTLSPDTRCPLCECRDPCAEADCGPGHDCHVVDVSCDAEYCPPVPACLPKKPGQCPYLIPVSSGSCDYQCRSDYNCNETAKCCSNGCGTQCVQPVVMTECQHRRAILRHESHESGVPAGKLWVPRCDQHGAYEPVQCHPATGQCWCVDSRGQEIPATRTQGGAKPDCQGSQSSSCPALKCARNCPHGYELDTRGCRTCACKDPCQDILCRGEGEACRMVQVQCKDPSAPCQAVPMCLPRRENPCQSGQPLEEGGNPVRCGPSGNSCPSSHKCELSPLGEYAVCCPKPRDVCFEPPQPGPCEHPTPRWYFNPERNACQQLPAELCGAQHNSFHTQDTCHKVCPVLSQCERLREKNQKAADKYKKWTFIPRCSSETGAWLPLQCLTQVGVCWCVAPDGQPIKGTLTRDLSPSCPNATKTSNRQARRRQDFDQLDIDWSDPERAVAKLLRGLDSSSALPALLQRIEEDLAPIHGSTPDLPVDPSPSLVPDFLRKVHRTRCLALRERSEDGDGASALECDTNGGFAPTQCAPRDDPDAECWCVDEAGNQLPNSTTFKRGQNICLPTPIEAVDVSLGFLGEPGVVDSLAEPGVLEAVRSALAWVVQGTAARHQDLRVQLHPGLAVATFSLHGPGKVDSAFQLEEMVKSGALSVSSGSPPLLADITRSRFSHRLAANEDAPRIIALQHREIVSESTVSEVTSYHTAILVLSAASAFVIVILAVLAALYRRRMLLAAMEKHQLADDDRFASCEPVYVVRLPCGPGDLRKLESSRVPLAEEDVIAKPGA